MRDNPFRYSLTTRFKDRHFLRLLDPRPGERVLDVGCGVGYLCEVLARGGDGRHIVGVDPSLESIRACRELAPGAFMAGDALALPFRASSFDCVALSDVIEHLADPDQALGEIRRVIKPGGRLVLSTPALEGPFTRTRLESFLHEERDELQMNHRAGFARAELCDLLRRHGFADLQAVYTNVFLTQLLIGVMKLAYATVRQRYTSQADALAASRSWLFAVNKHVVFPIGYAIGRVEERLFGRFLGHCSIVFGRAA